MNVKISIVKFVRMGVSIKDQIDGQQGLLDTTSIPYNYWPLCV